jgi:hypothetical protein
MLSFLLPYQAKHAHHPLLRTVLARTAWAKRWDLWLAAVIVALVLAISFTIGRDDNTVMNFTATVVAWLTTLACVGYTIVYVVTEMRRTLGNTQWELLRLSQYGITELLWAERERLRLHLWRVWLVTAGLWMLCAWLTLYGDLFAWPPAYGLGWLALTRTNALFGIFSVMLMVGIPLILWGCLLRCVNIVLHTMVTWHLFGRGGLVGAALQVLVIASLPLLLMPVPQYGLAIFALPDILQFYNLIFCVLQLYLTTLVPYVLLRTAPYFERAQAALQTADAAPLDTMAFASKPKRGQQG